MRDRTRELRQGDDSSDDEDKERVARVVHPGTARMGSPDDEFSRRLLFGKLGFSCSGMKQDLQNLRDEIKQLGRDIRAQLKGKLLGPQILSSGPAQLLDNLGNEFRSTGLTISSTNTFVSSHSIEPQKEEADENYNSVNTRMRKTQHGVCPAIRGAHQQVQLNAVRIREKNVERIRRQLKISEVMDTGTTPRSRVVYEPYPDFFLFFVIKAVS
ncbi:Syntaxin-4 [Camelus dromedarius]|uniref:Syntaxin-4 n=1 Tax=Camelus dromedarius TaxID=9838 RepID=A0A5N4CWN8_CAMDR|nr:Syntaxin-4 [Camelus dromedarius]